MSRVRPRTDFAALYGIDAQVRASAPGRVNLLGDHTDYNGGFVLPTTIPQHTTVEAAIGNGPDEVYSANLDKHIRFSRKGTLTGFAKYVGGCLRVLESQGISVPPLRLLVHSNVPLRAGLSSSASLEVATLRAVDALLSLSLDPMEIATLAQRAETEHAKVACGIMDQMASSLGRPDMMLFLDTLTLEQRLLPIPSGSELVVIDSGVPRELANSPYNQRRQECAAAAEALGVDCLRRVKDIAMLEALAPPLRQRARHVLTENQRVLAAATAGAKQFGDLMNQSHRSLATDFDVSTPEVDRLVTFLQERPSTFGARMTGAGFGGACVALVECGSSAELARKAVSWAREHPDLRVRIVVPPRDGELKQARA